jgi:hypothetical protein
MNPNKCAFGVLAGQFLGLLIHERGIEVGQNSISAIDKIEAPLLTVNFRQPSHEFTFNVGIDLLF